MRPSAVRAGCENGVRGDELKPASVAGVADSDPVAEYEETLAKGLARFQALQP